MAKGPAFFEQLIFAIMRRINVMHLCRVTSYDSIAQRANVQPLALRSDNAKRSLIQDAMVLNHCRETIAVGKVVCVVFADRDLDNFNGRNDFRLSSTRMHSLNDAVIVGVYG